MGLNIAECMLLAEAQFPDKEALIFEDLRLSFAALAAGARRVANVLLDRGVKPGDRVALMLPNIPQFVLAYYGVLYAGAVVVPLNVMLRRREIVFQLRDSGAKAILVFEDFADEACAALEQLSEPPILLMVEGSFAPAAHAQGESFSAALAAASTEFDLVQTAPEDPAVIFYTSAMRGTPLGATLSHFNIFQNAQTVREYGLKYYPEDVFIAGLPLFHAFGQTTMLHAPLMAGGCVVVMPRFEPAKVLEAIQRERATVMAVVPTMLHVLSTYKPAEHFDLKSLRSVVSGGAKMDLKVAESFTKRFGITVLEGYGLSETGPVVSFNLTKESNKPGTVGVPLWGTYVKIMRTDGSFAKTGEIGEIAVRGHGVMKGYWNEPEETAKAMRHGWFHTGDAGFLDDDGCITITGVIKDLIIRTGLNVYARELELVLESHPAVAEAAVVGVPDAVRGEEVRAWVVLQPSAAPSIIAELQAYCRAELSVYKVPKRIEAVAALPRRSDGSLDKAALRALATAPQRSALSA